MSWKKMTSFCILAFAIILISSLAFGIPYYIYDQEPDDVISYRGTSYNCDSPEECLNEVDGGTTSFYKDTSLESEWNDPYSGGKIINFIKLQSWIDPGLSRDRADTDSIDVQVYNGGWVNMGQVSVSEPGWYNFSIGGELPSEGPYKVRLVSNEQKGFDNTYADYLHLKINYTDIGSLSKQNQLTSVDPDYYWKVWDPINTTKIFCEGGYCGVISFTLYIDGSKPDGTYFEVSEDNPQLFEACKEDEYAKGTLYGSCNEMKDTFAADWEILPLEIGSYQSSLDMETEYHGDYDLGPAPLNVSYGYMTLEGVDMPSSVDKGDPFWVNSTVKCSKTYCGEIESSVLRSGELLQNTQGFTISSGSNPENLGAMNSSEEESEIKFLAEETGNYSITLKAESNEDSVESVSEEFDLEVVETDSGDSEPKYLSVKDVRIQGSNSKNLEISFDYNSSVIFDASCVLNGLTSQSCSIDKASPGIGTKSCSVSYPSYEKSNTVECTLKNTSSNLEESQSEDFRVSGTISSVSTDRNTYNIFNNREVSARCAVSNTGDITFLGGSNSSGYTSLDMEIIGPEGYSEKRSVIQSNDLVPGDSTTIRESFTLPKSASEGEWSVECSNYNIIDLLKLSLDTMSSSFTVTNESSVKSLYVSFLSPSITEKYSIGQKIDLMLEVEDSKGNKVEGARVEVNGKDLVDEGEGIYTGTIEIPFKTGQSYEVSAEASKENYNSYKTSIVLSLSREFSLNLDIEDQYRIGDSIELEGKLDAKRALENPVVELKFYGPENELQGKKEATVTDNDFSASFSLDSGFPTGKWELNATATDEGSSDFKTFEFDVKKARSGSFYFEFVKPEKRTFERMSKMPVEIHALDSQTGKPVSLEEITCKLDKEKFALNKSGEGHTAIFKIPKDFEAGNKYLRCNGERIFKGKSIEQSNSVILTIKPLDLKLNVLEPEDKNFRIGEEVRFKVNLTYRKEPIENASIRLYLNGKRTSIKLGETEKPGIYERKYQVGRRINSFSFKAQDDSGNKGSSKVLNANTKLEKGFNWMLYGIYFILFLGSGFAVYMIYSHLSMGDEERKRIAMKRKRRKEKLKDKLDDLKMELRSIESSRKEAQRNYYKRKIDEKTFKQMMQKYEQERTEVRNRIGEVKKELENYG